MNEKVRDLLERAENANTEYAKVYATMALVHQVAELTEAVRGRDDSGPVWPHERPQPIRRAAPIPYPVEDADIAYPLGSYRVSDDLAYEPSDPKTVDVGDLEDRIEADR